MQIKTALKLIIPAVGMLIGSSNMLAEKSEQILSREQGKAIIKSWTKEQKADYYKRFHVRTPEAKNTDMYIKGLTSAKKSENQILGGTKMPDKVIVPGEFEEVQAILITWPYYSIDANGDQNEQLFAGYGDEYDAQGNPTGGLIKVQNYIDLEEGSSMAPIFAKLAYAIDQEVEVWINIWDAADSTAILDYMNAAGMPLKRAKFFVNPGNSFWYRDCGPVACYYGDKDSIAFIDFEYYGGRPLDDRIPVEVGTKMGFPVYTNTIEYEGGNILVDGAGKLFTSTAVKELNADTYGLYYIDSTAGKKTIAIQKKTPVGTTALIDSLKNLMNLNKCVIVNKLKYDGGTGHIDLYADLFDENIFVFSRMPSNLSKFTDYSIVTKNVDSLVSLSTVNGPKFLQRSIGFPAKDDGTWYTSNSDYNKYTRTYSNHTFVNKTIIQPVFYNEDDGDIDNEKANIAQLKKQYPGYKIAEIDIRAFDGFGGAIHCITKQIPAENPIRIFHFPIDKSQLVGTSFPINSTILNKSGIKEATFKYRAKGATDWKSISLTSGANNAFTGLLPANAQAESDTVEYYITATSNNGKTIAKPMTAPEGFYTFVYGSKVTDVEEANNDNSEFYPNPATTQASLAITSAYGSNFEMSIFNLNGVQVYSNTFNGLSNNQQIDLNTANLSEGVYFVKFQLENGKTITKKLTVKK